MPEGALCHLRPSRPRPAFCVRAKTANGASWPTARRRSASEFVLSTSAIYELIEWAGAEVLDGGLGRTFLATQNDRWDPQKDIALAAAGMRQQAVDPSDAAEDRKLLALALAAEPRLRASAACTSSASPFVLGGLLLLASLPYLLRRIQIHACIYVVCMHS